MTAFVEISVNVPQVSGLFHYHLPPELEGRVAAGHLVEVPFGRQRVQGVVMRAVAEPEVPETRPVLALLDAEPVLTPAQIALASALADSTLSPLAAIIALMLPPGLAQQADVRYALVGELVDAAAAGVAGSTAARLLKLLQKRGPLRGRQIDAALPRLDWRPAAQALVRRGVLTAQAVLAPPSVRARMARSVALAVSIPAAEAAMPSLARPNTPALARRQAILRCLMREAQPVEVSWVYAETGGNLEDLYALADKGLVTLTETQVWRDPLAEMSPPPLPPPVLTADQQAVWQEIQPALRRASSTQPLAPILLHGVTGSGKTEIYLRAVAETLLLGRQAIVLVPEIALTPQTVQRFVARFPGQVGLAHSRLSPGERYDTWRRARAGSLAVMVGPRSALFTPFANLGLIVVDECHDDSYYQAEPPFYHAREAAVLYAQLAGAVCLLGSATPDVVSFHRARQGVWQIQHLPERILAHRQAIQAQAERLGIQSRYRPLEAQAEMMALPPVQVVDMRQELRVGNRSIFSAALQTALAETLRQGQQAILFLNRRGAATYVFCRECGETLKCPHCDLPLTVHVARPSADSSASPPAQPATLTLLCHHCAYRRTMPLECPACGSRHIRQLGAGTEKVEAEVQRLFPQARTLRWDYDTTRTKGAHEIILSHFAAHRADVLIGTQMIAKGLDLPLVTLVGVVLADVGLSLPDYRAAERTFAILTQVGGRAGRSPLGGQVILQTYQPEHYVIQAAARHDYEGFYHREIEQRRRLGYPPFGRLVRLEYRHVNAERAETAARALAGQIRAWLTTAERRATEIIGPAPCFFAQLAGLHRWQIILRGPDPVSLLRGRPLADWRVEVDPPALL